MATPSEPSEIITANRTDDGSVVYLVSGRRWSGDLQAAQSFDDAAVRDAELSWARTDQRQVCDPYVIAVGAEDGVLVPSSTRERLRAAGPERVRRAFGYEPV